MEVVTIKILYTVLVSMGAMLIGMLLGYIIRRIIAEKKIRSAEIMADNIVIDARKKAESTKKEMLIEAKDEIHVLRLDLEKETRERRNEIQTHERRNVQKEESLDKKISNLERKEKDVAKSLRDVESLKNEYSIKIGRQNEELERIAALSKEDAKRELLENLDKTLTREKVTRIREMESEIKEESGKKAKEIIAYAIQKCATEYVAESTVSVVALPNDEMKGRIIGREGRNIRAFETATGVDLIIDDTPEAVILSSFDPVRREVARISLDRLIADGRIHPTRIEEAVKRATQEVEDAMKEDGENAVFEVGIHNVHPEIVKLLGRLRFRTSYGQNVLKHSIEVAKIAGHLAGELGLDQRIAKRAGLLHDIGKAVDYDMEGTHIELGMNILKRYKENKKVIHAMSTHHGDFEPETIEAILVTVADAISASRPGARRETLDNYVKRLETLEEISNSYEGVEKSFAIQAGREIRIMVSPEKVNDEQMIILSREISQRIESEMEYPGQIKVHIIRESRAINYAK